MGRKRRRYSNQETPEENLISCTQVSPSPSDKTLRNGQRQRPSTEQNVRNIQRIAKIAADSNGAITEPQIRWWINQAGNNGLNELGAIIRIGRAVYIDIDLFDRWLTSQSQKAAA